MRRSRLWYALAVAMVVLAGLAVRSGMTPFPGFVVKYGGVALWALVVFLGLGLVSPAAPTAWVAWVAVCISWCVEFLQMYHAPWIDAVRATRLGHLVLGSTFHGPDLLAYCLGVGIGAGAEIARGRRRRAVRESDPARTGAGP